jgi:hypothetical protein
LVALAGLAMDAARTRPGRAFSLDETPGPGWAAVVAGKPLGAFPGPG